MSKDKYITLDGIALADFLTKTEMYKAWQLYEKLKNSGKFATECSTNIIEPVIKRINRKLNKECIPKYLAYSVEYAFSNLKG